MTKPNDLAKKALELFDGDINALAQAVGVFYTTAKRWMVEGTKPNRLAREKLKQILGGKKS